MLSSLYFYHIYMNMVENERFPEFGVFQIEKKDPPKTSWTTDNIVVWALSKFPSDTLSIYELV